MGSEVEKSHGVSFNEASIMKPLQSAREVLKQVENIPKVLTKAQRTIVQIDNT